jgi:hypothetical protein
MLRCYFTFFRCHIFHFFNIFSGSVLVYGHSLSCTWLSVFWLDRMSYRNYPSTLSSSVSIEALPASEQLLLFCWWQPWSGGTRILCPCLHILEGTTSTQWLHHTAYVSIPNLKALRGRYCLKDRQPFRVNSSSVEMS